MRKVNLSGVDLNLLVALRALLDERSVTRAARQVGLSQPAMSRALGRLRALFNDRLLVRTARGMALTARAEALSEELRRTLSGIERLIEPPSFDPAQARGAFRVAATDYAAMVVLPAVLGRFYASAPHMDLEVVPMDETAIEGLETGAVDLAVGLFPEAPAGMYRRALFTETFVCVVRSGHPAASRGLSLEDYRAAAHGLVTVPSSHRGSLMDAVVKSLGKRQRFALRIPHFLAAPVIVAETDLVLTLPRRLARRFAETAGLTILEPPVELPEVTISELWHERRHHDPAHVWLRNLFAARSRDL